jgi:hypothetical protein
MGDGSNAMTFTESQWMAAEFKRRGYDVTYYQTTAASCVRTA